MPGINRPTINITKSFAIVTTATTATDTTTTTYFFLIYRINQLSTRKKAVYLRIEIWPWF